MSLNNIISNIKSKEIEEMYNKNYDVINYEGFPAFKNDKLKRLREILFLGTTGNTFYVDGYNNINAKINDLKDLISMNDLNPGDLIVEARNKGFFRHIPIIALVLLRNYDPNKFKEIFNKVIITGQDLFDFVCLNKALGFGFGRSVKTAINEWLKNVSSFHAIKYRKILKKVIRISRPKINEYQNKDILEYIYNSKKKPYIIINKQIEYSEKFKDSVSNNRIDDAIKYAEEGKLPADLMIGLIGKSDNDKIWYTIAKNMGVNQFIKYLNKLSKVLDYTTLISLINEKMTIDNLLRAKVFPFRIFVAANNVDNVDVARILMGRGEDFLNHYNFDKWSKYSFAICPDISGSMGGRFSEISGFLSGVLSKGTKSDYIYLWNVSCKPFMVKNKSVYSIYEKIKNSAFGGTSMGSPIDYLIKNKIKKDFIILITDEIHWFGGIEKSFIKAWIMYKQNINKNAKAIILNIAGYDQSSGEEQIYNKYDVFTIYGWSDVVIDFIEQIILSGG